MTGLRLGEAQALEWADLDFKNETIELKNQCFIKCTKFYCTEPKREQVFERLR